MVLAYCFVAFYKLYEILKGFNFFLQSEDLVEYFPRLSLNQKRNFIEQFLNQFIGSLPNLRNMFVGKFFNHNEEIVFQ